MSDNKVIKSRILQRIDTEEKWNAINPVLSCSEIIFSKTPGGVFMKLGDGRKYSETPFYQDIKIDESQISSLNILHISQSDYSKLVVEDNVLSNALYIISSDNMDMTGEQIKNLADATDLSDAVNLHQVQDAISQVNEQFSGYVPTHRSINGIQLTGDLSVGTITGIKMNGALKGQSGIVNLGTVLTAHQSLINYVTKNELSTKSSVFVDNNQTDLNVIHIDNSEYSNIVNSDSVDSNTIYIVSSDVFNVYGEQIKNVANATDLSDAVNLGQINELIQPLNQNIDTKVSSLIMNGHELTSTNGRINLGSVISTHQNLSGYVIKNISSDFSVNLTGDFIFQSSGGQNVKFKNGYVEFNGTDNGIEFNNGSYNAFHAGGGIVVEDINNYKVEKDGLYSGANGIGHIISAEMLSAYAKNSDIDSKLSSMNTNVNTKSSVFVDGQVSDIQIVHIELSDYEQLVIDDNINPNYVYITQSDTHNVYGERITNVAEAIDENDAIPLKQVQRDYISKTSLANALSQLNENNCTAGDILNVLKSLI